MGVSLFTGGHTAVAAGAREGGFGWVSNHSRAAHLSTGSWKEGSLESGLAKGMVEQER